MWPIEKQKTGAGFELGKTLANEVIKVKAARDFGDAVQKADPAIGQISDLAKSRSRRRSMRC